MIPIEFKITRIIFQKYGLHKYEITRGWDYNDYRFDLYEFQNEKNHDTGNSYGYDIRTNFNKEYDEFGKAGKYFIGCPFSIYKLTYNERLQDFINDNIHDLYDETHFIKTELRDTLEYEVDSIFNSKTREKLMKSIFRRKEFLVDKLESLGFVYSVTKDEYGKITSVSKKATKKASEQETTLDLSDTNLAEKIIYLKLLGVYDYLVTKEPFNTSKNRLATVISAITSEKATSIQSAINPIDNLSASQKNNPLENNKSVEKIKLKLIDLGFKF